MLGQKDDFEEKICNVSSYNDLLRKKIHVLKIEKKTT